MTTEMVGILTPEGELLKVSDTVPAGVMLNYDGPVLFSSLKEAQVADGGWLTPAGSYKYCKVTLTVDTAELA